MYRAPQKLHMLPYRIWVNESHASTKNYDVTINQKHVHILMDIWAAVTKRYEAVWSLSAKSSTDFIWKLCSHWLKGLQQHQVTIIIQAPVSKLPFLFASDPQQGAGHWVDQKGTSTCFPGERLLHRVPPGQTGLTGPARGTSRGDHQLQAWQRGTPQETQEECGRKNGGGDRPN